MVLMVLEAKFGERPTSMTTVTLCSPTSTSRSGFGCDTNSPAIEIFARVAHGIRSRRATAAEIAVLNRDNPWVKWTLRGAHGVAAHHDPGAPFVPAHLDGMVDVFLVAMTGDA